MSLIPVEAESPSALTEPRILTSSAAVLVSWHPERGWLCEEDLVQPCIHTVDLIPDKHPLWRQ